MAAKKSEGQINNKDSYYKINRVCSKCRLSVVGAEVQDNLKKKQRAQAERLTNHFLLKKMTVFK